jgi:hypothetical protein
LYLPPIAVPNSEKKAERVIAGLEKPMNDRLLKLWTIPDAFDREGWMANLVNWIDGSKKLSSGQTMRGRLISFTTNCCSLRPSVAG